MNSNSLRASCLCAALLNARSPAFKYLLLNRKKTEWKSAEEVCPVSQHCVKKHPNVLLPEREEYHACVQKHIFHVNVVPIH